MITALSTTVCLPFVLFQQMKEKLLRCSIRDLVVFSQVAHSLF